MLVVSHLLSVVKAEQLTINEEPRTGFFKLDTDKHRFKRLYFK
jgi:hypothetical protein